MAKKNKQKIKKLNDEEYGKYIMSLKDEQPIESYKPSKWENLSKERFFCYIVVIFLSLLYNKGSALHY